MLHLPFMEDIRQYTFPSLSGPSGSATPSAEQLVAVDSLISSMDLMSADRDPITAGTRMGRDAKH
jgi:hypothetical protein